MRHLKSFLANSYVIGLAATAAAVFLLMSVQGVFKGNPPLLLCLLPVILAVWRGHLGAGLLTLAVSALATDYLLLEPYYSLAIAHSSEVWRLVLLVGVGGLLSVLVARSRKREIEALQAARDHAVQLGVEVAERLEVEQALLAAKAELERGVADRTAELEAADQTLKRQGMYLDAFFRHSLTPLVVLDRDFNFIRVNKAYADACGKTPEDFIGHNHFELYPEDARPVFEQVVRTKRPLDTAGQPFIFPDHPEWGTTYWDWTLTPLMDEQGEVEVLFFVLEDVTARKRHEMAMESYRDQLEARVGEQTRELEVTNARLQADIAAREAAESKRMELEGMLQKLVQLAPEVICSFRMRPDGRFCFPYATDAITEIYGVPPGQLAEDAGCVFEMMPAEDAERLRHNIGESARTLSPWHDEWRVRNPRKGEIWVEGKSIPTAEPDGGVLWFGFIHDITERKRVEEALREGDRRKNEFLAMLGHELRNPLAPIRNAVQILKMRSPHDPTEQWARDVIERQAGIMARLLDDLLDVARIMHGKISLKRESLDLHEIVDSATEACRPLIESRRHELIIAPRGEPLWIEGDRVRLTQVLANLLNNAAKYTGEGGRIEVEVSRDATSGYVRVRDNGVGIAPEYLEHVFELFSQSGRSIANSQGGLGIGLTLASRLVGMHGGSLSVASDGVGRGSQFTMRLPLPAQRQPSTERVRLGSTPVAPLRILVVDDFADVANTLALLLESAGHHVKIAYCGVDALQLAPVFRPQVVMLDIGLPDLDGHEVARRLHDLPETRAAVYIALTGYGQPKDIEVSRATGFDCHLVKPVEFNEINRVLASFQDRIERGPAEAS